MVSSLMIHFRHIDIELQENLSYMFYGTLSNDPYFIHRDSIDSKSLN